MNEMTAQPTLGSAQARVCVLGSGVIGLTTAKLLLESGVADVTVVGDLWTPDTTSDGAAAFWERRKDAHSAWARATMKHYEALLDSGLGGVTGVGLIDGSNYAHDSQQYEGYAEDVPMFRNSTPEEVGEASRRLNEPFQSGVHWRSVIVDSPRYLRWLMGCIRASGGKFAQARVDSLDDLSKHFHVVVNATGHGARELAGDDKCHAYRGQVIRVWAPHIKTFATATCAPESEWHATYVLPRPTSGIVTCGGTYQRDREFTGCDPVDRAGIWERCCALVPELLDPRTVVIDDWAGLRPGRDEDVRIELERREGSGLWVVHAYGHGGCGHSLHYGTAQDALALVQQAVAKLGVDGAGLPALQPFVAPEPAIRPSVHMLIPDLAKAAGPATVEALLGRSKPTV